MSKQLELNQDDKTQDGLPDKQQLYYMLQRYSSVKLTPIDNQQEPIVVKTATADFKKPIFANNVDGSITNKISMALQYQGAFPQQDAAIPSRLLLDGNLSLINSAMNMHRKLLGDDPYDIKQPFDHPLMLMEGNNIPEYNLYDIIEEEGGEL